MAEVTLYHWEPNANSGKPMLALMEKGVAFDSHYIDMLNFDQHKPEYLAINPQGTIPAMTHGSLVLVESTAIMEYVNDAFDGPSLMPESARDRLRIRWWMNMVPITWLFSTVRSTSIRFTKSAAKQRSSLPFRCNCPATCIVSG